MKIQTIRNVAGEVLFEGCFETMKACVEMAVEAGVCLDGAQIPGANLTNASLDGARLRGARLYNANLTGANLSEAQMDGTDFTNATLLGACLCRSSLRGCNFDAASFDGTDITGSDIGGSQFSTPSALLLNFIDTADMSGCYFSVSTTRACLMTRPPVVIHGLPFPVVFMDDMVKIGPVLRSRRELLALTNDNCPPAPERFEDGHLHAFIHRYRDILQGLARNLRPENVDINSIKLYK
ncbi:MAG TPA: pentapeptide repeat-containing protein [Alphaproteobacteria bacterium]|jgi:hypothetical protein